MNIYIVKVVKDESFENYYVVAPNERTAKKRFNALKKEFDVIVKVSSIGALWEVLYNHDVNEDIINAIVSAVK